MKKKKKIIIGLVALIATILTGVLFFGVLKPKGARLAIDTTPPATVTINGEQMGRTPFEKDFLAGEIEVKLIPDLGEKPLVAYETKVMLEGGIKTIIHRSFAESEEASSGEVVSFEKIGGRTAEVSVISMPDGANVKCDNITRGTTPIKLSDVTAAVHQILVSATGYGERSVPIQTVNGYRLIAVVKLPLTGEAGPVATPAPTAAPSSASQKIDEVVILTTPTGFLRVRSEPNISASEVGRVTPGKKYKFIEKDEKTGWYKITVSDNVSGWVSSEYASASAKASN